MSTQNYNRNKYTKTTNVLDEYIGMKYDAAAKWLKKNERRRRKNKKRFK